MQVLVLSIAWFGQLVDPVRAEATKHVLPGCQSLGRPAAVCAAVGTTGEASKIGGLNIKEYLQPRKLSPRKVVFVGSSGTADPNAFMGKADDAEEETIKCTSRKPPGQGPRHLGRIH